MHDIPIPLGAHDAATRRLPRSGRALPFSHGGGLSRIILAVGSPRPGNSSALFSSFFSACRPSPPDPTGRAQRRSTLVTGGRSTAGFMRCVALSIGFVALATIANTASAQSKPAKQDDPTDDITVNGKRVESCSAPSAGGARGIDYDCLNSALKTAASAGQPPLPGADATTDQANVPSRVGTFSYSATSERMGKNFWHSATPYRPPPPVYGHGATGARPPSGITPR